MLLQTFIITILLPLSTHTLATTNPFPQQTSTPTIPTSSKPTTPTQPTSPITTARNLTCTPPSTILHTTECTYGHPISYCHSPPPPLTCPPSSFPTIYNPIRCITASTCYPLNASFITTGCSFGGIPYSTSTLYAGTLAGNQSTIITNVQCACATDQWYSLTRLPGQAQVDGFCMPTRACPEGMTTSTRTNSYCRTATCGEDVPRTTDYCHCGMGSTAVYEEGKASATAVGCRAVGGGLGG